MKQLLKCAAVLAATVSALAFATPAEAYSDITIDSPNGSEVEPDTQVMVSGYNGSGSSETIYVQCDSGQYDSTSVPAGDFSVPLSTFTGPDTCGIYDWYSDDLLASFTVAGPTTTVSNASVSSDAFYPVVRDRYQDSVTFRWRQNHDGRATITVVNATGHKVRTASPRAWRGRNDWTWNGKKANGSPVGAGRYRIRVAVNSNTVAAAVVAKTEIVTKSFSRRKEGNKASSFATRGSCYATRDSYYQVADLDCWGGQFAKANYRIVIPASAFDVRGTIDLNASGADYCCHGRISKGWSRPTSRTVAFWAKVTDLRATEVNFVRVSYKQKVRI